LGNLWLLPLALGPPPSFLAALLAGSRAKLANQKFRKLTRRIRQKLGEFQIFDCPAPTTTNRNFRHRHAKLSLQRRRGTVENTKGRSKSR